MFGRYPIVGYKVYHIYMVNLGMRGVWSICELTIYMVDVISHEGITQTLSYSLR